MRNVIKKHLQAKPVKNFDLSIKNAEVELQKMAQIVVNFVTDRSDENLKLLRQTKSYWESFFSDWVADIEMKEAVLTCIKTGDRADLNAHLHYILKLAEDACAEPEDKSAPKKEKKGFEHSFLDELRASDKPYFGFH